jgi:hypothetical protein
MAQKDNSEKTTPRPERGIGGTGKVGYRSPDDISIPKEVEEAFSKQGYSLRWVRIIDPRTRMIDHSRINYFVSNGGLLVTANEIKKVDRSFLGHMLKYTYVEEFADEEETAERGGQLGLRRGDVVLMKLPREFVDEQRADLAKQNADNMRAIEDTHKSQTGGGKYETRVVEEGVKTASRGSEFFEQA